MDTRIVVSAALLGRDHAVVGRNLQDHAVAACGGDHAVAAVSDGCGEGEGSELGARIAAIVGCRAAAAALAQGAPMGELAPIVGGAVLAALAGVTAVVAGPDRAARSRFAAEHLAATLWIVAGRSHERIVFGWGDGVLRIDDRVVVIDEAGRPAYLVRALGTEAVPAPSHLLAADGAALVAVATDGWCGDDLRQLPIGTSSAALLRWMRLRQREGAFRDDGAVAAVVGARAEAR